MNALRISLVTGMALQGVSLVALAEPAAAGRCLQSTPVGLVFMATPECLSAIKPGAPERPHIFKNIGDAALKEAELSARKNGAGGRSENPLKELGDLSHWERPPVSGPLGRAVRKP